MTVQTQFYNYQSNPDRLNWDAVPWEGCNSPAVEMRQYLENRWGLTYLGCHGDRPIVGGTSQSTHGFGMAVDMRYENPGPGMHVCETEIIPWLIATSRETGLQAIHHYRRSLIWRPPHTSGRGDDGWKVQPASGQMGQAWALWLHLEFHPATVHDGRSIEEKLGQLPPVINPPTPVPPVIVNPPTDPLPPGQEFTLDINISTVKRGSTGQDVKRAQAILTHNFGQGAHVGVIDGNFGPKTEQAVRNVQAFLGMAVDGIVGPKTWKVLIELP